MMKLVALCDFGDTTLQLRKTSLEELDSFTVSSHNSKSGQLCVRPGKGLRLEKSWEFPVVSDSRKRCSLPRIHRIYSLYLD